MDREPTPDPSRRPFETEVSGAVVLDATTGLILEANQAAAKIFGFGSPQEMAGLNPLDYVADEDRQPVALLLAQGLETDRPTPAEIRMKTRDGRVIWVSAAIVLTEHEGKKAALTTMREITSEKAKDAALKEAEHQYQRLFDSMLDGAVVLDVSSFQIVLANKAAADTFGFSSPREIVGQNPLSYIPEEDRDGVARLIALNLEGKATNPAELRVLTTDKRQRWVSATATKVDYEGRTAILSTLRDITSEKAKDAALQAAEETKLRLIDAATEAITIVQDGKLVYVNPAVAKGAGISQQQLIGLSFLDLVHPNERQAVSERYERILTGEWSHEPATIKGVGAQGQTLWAEIREIPYTWQGKPAVMSLIHDITDKVLAEQERKEQEERLRAIVENAWDGVFIFDENYNVLFDSPTLPRMTGYTQEQWKGRSPAEWPIHPDDLPSMLTNLEDLKSRQGSTISNIRMRFRHKDGSWRWIEANGRNLLQDPKVKGLVANFRDITENVRAEESLKASEERFRTLIEKATDVVIVLDANGKIIYQSPSLERVTGFGPNEWVDRSLGELLIHPDDLPSLASLLERILTQPGATVEGITVRYQHKDGSWHTLEATVTNMLHDPKVNGLVANFRDVTDRKEAEEALKRSEALLRDTQQLASVGGWEYDVERKEAIWTDETYLIHEIPKIPTIDHVAESLKCYPPEERQTIAQAFRKCLEEGVPYDLELPFVTFRGKRRRVRTTAKAIREGNRTVRVLGNIADITERKRMEDALRSSEERNRTIVENANEAVTVIQDGMLKFINPKFSAATGYTADEVLLKPFLELVHPDDRQMLADYYVRRQKGEDVPNTYQFRFLDKDGNKKWAEISAALFEWEGRPSTLGLMSDITERKKAEEALKESEAKYKRLFESTQTAVEVISMETGLVVLANEATARMFGFASPEDLVGEDSMKYLRPEDIGWVSEKMAQAVTDSSWREIQELQVRTKDGRWVWISGMVIQSEYQGKPALLVSLLDITSRKRSELTLQESEEKYRLLTEKTNDIIYTTDLDFNDTYVSPSVERILGFAPEEYLGRSPDQRMTLESLARAQEALLTHLSLEKDPKADPNRTVRMELEFYRKDGSTVWLEHQVSALRDANGTAIGLHGVARDITERRKAQEAVRQSEERYRLIAEKTNDVIWTADLNLRTTYVSPSIERVLGFTPEERLRQDAAQQMMPESLARAAEALSQHLALERDPTADPNRTLRIELEYYHKDGSTVWLENQVSGIRDANGSLIGFHGVARDITERKKAEQALKESEAKYRLVADSTNDEIWTSDINLNTTYVSPSVERVLGFTVEERMKQDIMAQMTPESFARASEALAYHLALEEDPKADPNRVLRIELEYYRKDGSTVWLENQVSGIRDASGKLVGFHGVARDVTERRKTEQALRASEEKYRLLTEKTNDVIWTTGLDLLTNYISPSVERILGFTPEHTLGQDVAEQMTPESVARAKEALARHLVLEQYPNSDPNRNLRIELEYYHKDGSTVWLENQVSGIRDAGGKLVGFHGVARDITERRKTEQALKESERKYRVLAENTNDLIWMADLNMRPTYMSPSTERIMGFTPEESLKRDLADNTTPESLAKAQEVLLHHLALEEDPSADPNRTLILELEFYRKDGSTVWLEQHVNGIRDADGTLVGFHGVARDVTERKLAEQALRERLKELQCIAGVSRLAEKPELPIEDFVREAVGLLPAAWQYPDICVARIQLDSKEFKTANYHETEWSQSADIRVDEKRFGTVTVCYLQEMPEADEGPFLKEERTLIDTIADFLGHVIQHRQMEQYLRASEERYRLLAQNASDIIWVIDANLKITYISPSATSLLRYSVEELMTGSFERALTPESLARVAQVYMDDMVTEKSTPGSTGQRLVEIEVVPKDGATVWLEAVTNPTRDADGRLSGFQGACRDVTKRRRAQEALATSETNYRNLFHQTLLGMEVVDGQTGKVVLANHAIARMFGFNSPEEMVGLDAITGWVLPEDMEWVLREFARAMADPEKRDVATLRVRGKDGRMVWVSGSGTLFDYEGKPAILISLIDVTAGKEAEGKLRESEEKNRLLIENAAEGIAVIQDGMAKFFNRRLVDLTGWTEEKLLTRSFLDLVHPDEREMIALNYMKRVAGEDVPNNYVFRIIDKEGNTKWLQVSAVRFNWEGKPATLTMFSEVTERVKAEEKLKESEGRYRLLAENATDVIWVADLNLRITYATPAVTRLLGYTMEEVAAGSFLNEALTPDSLSSMAQVFTEDLAAEDSRPGSWRERAVEIEVVSKDGSKYWLEAAISGIRDTAGRLIAFQGACRNITDRKKAEELLRNSEERFRGLVETTSDWVWEMDRNSRYTYVSPKVRDILGYEPEELMGHTPFQFMHQREGRRVSKIVRRFAAGSLPFSLLENTCVHKDGHSVILETSAVPIIGSDGSLLGYRGIDRDITERKKAEQELQHSLKRLEKTMDSTIEAITNTIETRDPYTTGHQMRVTDLACAIAKVMEVPPTQIEGIRVAGLLHDIGKIAIPTEILSKPGKLNDVEYEMIKTHSKVGYNILKKIDFPWPVARTVLQHHERWNGSGYPHGIRGEDILLEARILAVADVMEAMSSHRPYRPSIGGDKALDEISKNSGILYDPAVADACITAFTRAGFKFASSLPSTAGEIDGTSASHPVHYQEDR